MDIILTTNHGHIIGSSADGRVVMHSGGLLTIDGRNVHQGYWCDPATGMATQDPVPDADWAVARDAIRAVYGAQAAAEAASREATLRRLDERDALLDGIERVRGGAYDQEA